MGVFAFLFTDIEGSTGLLQRVGAEVYAGVLADHHALIRSALAGHGGVELNTAGDGFFAEFSSPRACVAAALEMQQALAVHEWPTGEQVRVRMGVHAGEAQETATGPVGLDVHRAARIAAVGHGGQVLVSETAAALVRDGLPPGAGLTDLGLHRLRDLGRPEQIFQLRGPGLVADFPPLRSLDSPALRAEPGNLPVELTSFVGRARELAEIKRLLPASPIVTLTGPGGIGKSRLALRAAHKLGRSFPQGAWLTELAELDGPDLVPYALARALSVHERPDDGVQEALLTRLRGRRLLLVLDNCEHLLEACRQLAATVVSTCAEVRILCTSRERLGVAGEATVAVSALELPAIETRLPAAGLAQVEALRLLAERAVAVAPDFTLTEENCRTAGDICRRLDGLPLAIELAAVRLASMTADDLLERLDDRFRLLAADRQARPGRSQALRATVDWSHELLGPQERILWRRLSVFAGSFGLPAAEAVCSGAGLERERIVDLIARLVNSSILTMAHGSRHGRYRMLETVRLYGAERLGAAGEDDEIRERHASWYAELISPGGRAWWETPRQVEVLDALDVEWANVEAALEFCALSPVTAELGLQMAAALWLYWMIRGRYRAGCRHLTTFLTMVTAPSATRARAMCGFGELAQAIGEYDAALAHFEEARRVSGQAGWDRELAFAQAGLGLVRIRLGQTQLAGQMFATGLETAAGADEDAAGRAAALYFIATASAAAGRLADARRQALAGLRESDRAGDMWARGLLNSVLGLVEWLSGDHQAAETALKEAVRVQHRTGHWWGMANSLEGLAWVAGSSGRPERAALLLGASATLWEELGNALLPAWQSYHDGCEAAALEGLDEARYLTCWRQGHALGRDQVAAAALEDTTIPARLIPRGVVDDSVELSARELEVARLVAEGLSNPAIAAALFITVATVKTHVSHILAKLGLDSRVQLASWVTTHDPSASAPARG